MRLSRMVIGTAAGAALLLAACGGSTEPSSTETAPASATEAASDVTPPSPTSTASPGAPSNTRTAGVSENTPAAGSPGATNTPPPSATTAAIGYGTVEGCAARPSRSNGPVTDRQGPYYHQVVIAHTTDGIHLTGEHQVLEHASVPDGVRMPDGSVRIYYINAMDGGIWVARVDDDAVSPIGPISLNGVTNVAGAVDPDATLMPDGTIRLAYFASFGPPADPAAASGSTICIAESSDGIAFRIVARAIQFTKLTTDPSLVQLGDGSWLMAVSQGQTTALARSADGLQFTQFDTVGFGGVPELTPGPNGAVRLYVCERGIAAYLSADSGRTWQREATVAVASKAKIVCDPSRVAGTDLFVFKTGE